VFRPRFHQRLCAGSEARRIINSVWNIIFLCESKKVEVGLS